MFQHESSSGERLCETLSMTTKNIMENNDEFYKRMRMQEIEMERKKDIQLVLDLDNWLPPSVKSKLDEEEQKEQLREQQLEQRRKKSLSTIKPKVSTSRPTSGKKKK